MIKLSVRRAMEARGIDKPYKFLVKSGFGVTTSRIISTGTVEYLRLDNLEKLCVMLNCTPNDLLEWTPNSRKEDVAENPLQAIRKNEDSLNLGEVLKQLPMDKLRQVEEVLRKFQ